MPKSKANELALFAQYLNSNGQLNAITMSIDGLTDVDTTTTTPTNGQTLVWDGNNFVPGAGGGGGSSISNTNEITEGTDNSVGESSLGAADGTNNLFYTDARVDARIALQVGSSLDLSSKSTSDLGEGTNLYYTDARADARIAAATSDDVSEGSTNLYFTDERVDDRINALMIGGTNITLSYDDANNTFTINGDITDTDDLTEGSTNLYYTNARADARIAAANLADLNNVATTAPTDGQALVYSVSNTRWQPGTISGYATSDFNTDFATKSTSDLSEGTNLYYTNARADARITAILQDDDTFASPSATNIASSESIKAYVDAQVASKDALSELSGTTDDVTEGSTNLYYTNARVDAHLSGGTGVTYTTGEIAIGQDVSTTATPTFGNITTTGYLAGPATFTIDPAAVGDNTGTVVIAGNLQVDGTTTTINSTTLTVDDLNITVASGAANAAAANGAGLTVDGASATLTYVNPGDNWAFNKPLDMGANNITTTGNFVGNLTGQASDISNHDTGDLAEGTNLYYTDARVDTHLNQSSAGSNQVLSWNGSDYAWVAQTTVYGDSNVDTHLNTSTASTNEILSWNGSDYAWVADSGIALTDLSVGTEATASGDGAIAYNNSNGVFTYTPPVLSGLSGDTDDISEGSTNQYFTSARVQAENLGGSLAGTISDAKMQYATSYSGTAVQGSFFFDSLNAKVKVYNGSTFVDAVPASGGGGGGSSTDANTTFRKYIYTTTSATNSVSGKDDVVVTAGNFVEGYQYEIITVGTTDFTAIGASANTVGVTFTATGTGSGTGTAGHILNYATNGTENVEVYVNGIKQVEGSSYDYVATTGTSVNFVSNFASGDVVDIQVYELLTNDAYYTKTETYTQAEVNSQITTAVGGNLTLTGLTVDTDTLTVDTSNNRVGIGTATPGDRLEIDIAADNTGITLTDNGDSYTGKISFDSNELAKFSPLGIISAAWNGTEVANIRLNGADSNTTKNDGEISFHTKASSGSLAEAMRIDEDGLVGIGTTNPDRALHIEGSDFSSSTIRLKRTSGGTNNDAGLQFTSAAGANADTGMGGIWFQNSLDGNAYALIRARTDDATGTSGRLDFMTSTSLVDNNTSPSFTIGSSGNVGIGTDSPQSSLNILGDNTAVFASSDALYDKDHDAFLKIENQSETSNVEAGIVLRAKGTGAGVHAIYVKHQGTGTTYQGDLIFRSRNTATTSQDNMRITHDGRVSVGTSNNQLYGLFQVNQISDNDEDGIGLLNSTGVRSMRVYVNGDDRSVINSGNGGGQGLVLNEGGGDVNFGSNSTANNGHVQLSYGTTVTDPPTLTINATSQSTTAPGDVYGQIVFRVNNAAGVSASGLANTDSDSIAMITAQDWRDGSGKTNEDSGIGFYTSNTSGTLTFRGGFSNIGHFGIGTKNNDAGLPRLLSLSDPDPSIYAIDTDNNAYNEIIMQDGQMDYRADQGNTQGSSCHVWRVDGTQVAYLNADGMRFGNTTNAVNALDDYEEGTFSVTLTDGTNSASKDFKYVKVGRCVNIQGPTGTAQYWVLSASGTGAGTNLSFSGNLPFTPVDNGGIVSSAQRAIRQSNGTDFGTGVMPVLGWRQGSTQMYLDHTGREHTYEFANDCERDSTRTNIVMQFNGWYYTNS